MAPPGNIHLQGPGECIVMQLRSTAVVIKSTSEHPRNHLDNGEMGLNRVADTVLDDVLRGYLSSRV